MVKGTRGGKVGDKVEKWNTVINSNSSTDTNRKKKRENNDGMLEYRRKRKKRDIYMYWLVLEDGQDVIVLGFQTGQY